MIARWDSSSHAQSLPASLMPQRCVFLRVPLAPAALQRYRAEHDTLEGVCPPHTTVVFPSALPDDVACWQRAVADIARSSSPIDVTFEPGVVQVGDTVQLAIAEGRESLERIYHDLAAVLGVSTVTWHRPHVTIGRGAQLVVPAWLAETTARPQRLTQLVLEEIGPNDESLVFGRYELGSG